MRERFSPELAMVVRIVCPVRIGATRVDSVRALVRTVHELNRQYLRHNPTTPLLYKSGVVYQREPEAIREEFATIPQVLRQGWGDCDDLAPWRSAELAELHGIDALPDVLNPRPGLYHIIVRYPDGHTEDPSRILGM